ncbi:divisome protein SepX/GlpR [Rhodococcus spongiicola]|uniref:Transmembrane protein n=1 Tax=Rhodococcus spongiicola TaxID=2487352 RepID=A0A3S3AC19_9NOCA|nr:gephyrin-like molybdotransferase receptor GlpR [Rhodococcus spongiicola]RVW06756.1 hypothetical protein EF834_02425 [Rhodococcus spongiicola]
MPSSSIIWIALVAVWLFVLVPMLVNKRPRIRQTTDAALATRVLFHGGRERLARGPAVGHRSDPNWHYEPTDHDGDDMYATHAEDGMDVHADSELMDSELMDSEMMNDDYERDTARDFVPSRRGRGGFDPEADAIASAARYQFRQRAVLGLMFAAILTAALAMAVSAVMWWAFAAFSCSLVGYLGYLRRQVNLEQEIRRRRSARLVRSRLGVESDSDEELRLVPSRLRRPGAVVLEVDDEDPVFDHLEHFEGADEYEEYDVYDEYGDAMRRASGM